MNEILGENDYGGIFAMAEDPATIQEISDEADKRLAESLGFPTGNLQTKSRALIFLSIRLRF